ncbi:MAG: caspase family protein [Hyphomicrobiaceae bacterium]|nr:caspase family protein [Hyphomicrobiaceae bacterium]
MRSGISFLFFLIQFFGLASAVAAEGRVALVIANSTYSGAIGGNLPNTTAGGTIVADALRNVQFELAPPLKNLDRAQLEAEIRKLGQRAKSAGQKSISFLYFAGHGLSDATGRNYVLPVDMSYSDLAMLPTRALPVDWIIDTLHEIAPESEHIVVLDACRTELTSSVPGHSAGYAVTRSDELAPGFLLAFSADVGQAAPDSTVYATHLAAAIVRANLPLPAALEMVKTDVARASGGPGTGRRSPWHMDRLRNAIKLGYEVANDSSVPLEPTRHSRIMFLDSTPAYKNSDASSGIVEIRARGSVVRADRPDQIFIAKNEGEIRWVTYQSTWGRVYVPVRDNVRLF